jgi:hypothetical protein
LRLTRSSAVTAPGPEPDHPELADALQDVRAMSGTITPRDSAMQDAEAKRVIGIYRKRAPRYDHAIGIGASS